MMEHAWRSSLKKHIEDHYIQDDKQEWFETRLSTTGAINITVVSNQFASTPLAQRRDQLLEILKQYTVPARPGFLSLYTVPEAEVVGLSQPQTTTSPEITSWYDLASFAADPEELQRELTREPRNPRTVAFYSFKGGVGRTTALTHVAAILAMRGRKVVVVDLDLEAPGLSSAFGLEAPLYGLVDYFYERAYMPDDEEVKPAISVTEIFCEIPLQEASGRLFVVPAGVLNLDYVAKVDDLRSTTITARGESLWSIFFQEITEQLQPDILLVDSRTGINEWGAFSLLQAADKAVIFLYPNEQNKQGILLLTQALANMIPTYFVFSPVPAVGENGREKVEKLWQELQSEQENMDQETQGEQKNEKERGKTEDDQKVPNADPVVIPYLTSIALADTYPVSELLPYYMSLANIIDEDTNIVNIEAALSNTESRWRIVEDLVFPEVDAAQSHNLENLFQRTTDFDRFLDAATCLIRGRKGTGKTALYDLLLKHGEEARKLSRKRLDTVTCISGHGSFRIRPDKNEFQVIDRAIEQHRGSWEAFWRAYWFVRLHQEGRLQRLWRGSKLPQLRDFLARIPRDTEGWKTEYTEALIGMVIDTRFNLLLKDVMDDINSQLKKNTQGEVLWFLYDDLDVDFREDDELRRKALTGLFQFVQACDVRQLKNIVFKIFLREDIWARLVFDNKSHFNGRDITLRWARPDFLRLTLRQTQQSEQFRDLVDRFVPVENIDQAGEETLEQALQLLWGNRREKNPKSKHVSRWIYDRLTDSSGTTFPRSLNILLKTARENELSKYRGQPSPPPDRLLRFQSLIEGLREASEKRCQELKEEYQEFIPFFDALVGANVLISRTDLHAIWQRTVQSRISEFKDFKKFIDFLISIGLIRLAELREKEQGYRFAEIYTHGFKIYRGTRKY